VGPVADVELWGHQLPLYRQAEIHAHDGAALDRSTPTGWVSAIADLISPLPRCNHA
jgi:transposase